MPRPPPETECLLSGAAHRRNNLTDVHAQGLVIRKG